MNEMLENMSMDELEAQCKRIEELNNEESELWKRFEWEASPEGELEEYREECKAHFEEFNSVNTSNYKEKIDGLLKRADELYDKGETMREETIIDDIGYGYDSTYSMKDIDDIVEEFFDDVISLRDKVLYEYDVYDLIEEFEEQITEEQQIIALRKEGFSYAQITFTVEDSCIQDVIEVCKAAGLK